MKRQYAGLIGGLLAVGLLWAGSASADQNCYGIRYSALKQALNQAVEDEASGLNLQMWATVVNRDGVVCAVAFSGVDRGAQWPGSRVISAQKANTANAFSLDSSSGIGHDSGAAAGLALSTANLYSPVQPGGSLFGLQESNPVDTGVAYKGPAEHFGQQNDPMVGNRIGGVNVFGGGVALYSSQQRVIGASASAATRRAPTTASRGACATCWGSITCSASAASAAIRTGRTTSSISVPARRRTDSSIRIAAAATIPAICRPCRAEHRGARTRPGPGVRAS